MTKDEALKLALEALEEYHYGEARIILRQALEQPAIQQGWDVDTLLDKPPLPVQPTEEWPGQSNIESLHNACQHRGYCKQLKAQPAHEK